MSRCVTARSAGRRLIWPTWAVADGMSCRTGTACSGGVMITPSRAPRGAGRYAGRLVCRALCQGAALHYLDGTNGVKDFDVWSFYAERGDGPFPYGWRGQRITARRNSGDIQMTRHRSQAVASICSGDRSTCRLTPNRPKFPVTISLQRGPALRKNWRQKRPSSSTPNSSPVRSSGLRPVPRNDILI